jgi:opacity protein-like surface antigen
LFLSLNTYYVAAYRTQSVKRFVAPVITPYQSHVYVGLGFIAPGSTKAATSNVIPTSSINNTTEIVTVSATTNDHLATVKDSFGFALILGYRASQNWGTEVGLYDNGKQEKTTNVVIALRDKAGTPADQRLVDTTLKQTGHTYDVDFSILRYLQLGHSPISGFVRLGGGYHLYNETDTSLASLGSGKGAVGLSGAEKADSQSAGLLYGLGVQGDFSQQISVRFDYMVFDQSIMTSGDKTSKFMFSTLINF